MAEGTETELKFALDASGPPLLRDPRRLAGLDADPFVTRPLVSTYYDAADGCLAAAGVSFRVRSAGDAFEQTVKTTDAGGLLRRGEHTVALAGSDPDPALAGEDLLALLDGRALVPRFTIAVTRTSTCLRPEPGVVVEMAVDEGEVVAGDRRAPVRELELELLEGDLRVLFPLARRIMAGLPVRLAVESKSGIGQRLLSGARAAEPVHAEPVVVPADATVEMLLQAVLRSCLAQIVGNVGAVLDRAEPEGPHQLRVGLRRLRSALKLFRPVIDPQALVRVDGEARRLSRVVGELRDLDVLAEETVGVCSGRIDVTALLDLLDRHRESVRAAVRADLAGEAAGAFLIDLVGFTEGRGWLSASDLDQSRSLSAPAAVFGATALDRLWRKAARRSRRLADLPDEERHDLRKRLKTLRYALEFFEPLLPRGDWKPLVRQVKSAQEVLGYLNDVTVARTLPALVDARGGVRPSSREVDRAVGFCLGWHEAEGARIFAESLDRVILDRDAIRPLLRHVVV